VARGPREEVFSGKGNRAEGWRRPRETIVQTRETFDRELAALQDDMLRMGALVEEAVRRSIGALRARSVEGAEAVITADNAVDALHLELEERCLMLMATQQPMAKDLRTIAAVWAMTMDLERIGDHAEDIARATKRMADQPLLKPLIDIPRMADMVQRMLRMGLDAFVQRDVNLAQQMAAADDEVDHLYGQVFRELLTYMIEDPHNIQRATYLLFCAQALERMGDHATNIAERVIYMVTGTLKELNV
jgi:phosphate transport system protein